MRHALAIACLLLLAGCGGNGDEARTTTADEMPDETAAEFLVSVNEYLRKGQYRRAWAVLHPAQKKAVSASALSACFGPDQWGAKARFRVIESYPEPWDVAGGPANTSSTAVTFEISSEETNDVETFTQHAYSTNSGWTWSLAPDTFARAKTGGC